MVKLACRLLLCSLTLPVHGQIAPVATVDEVVWSADKRQSAAWSYPKSIKPSEDFSVALWVRLSGKGVGFPSLAANKIWDGSQEVDLLSTSNMGITLQSGVHRGWALALQPNGSWSWNAGNGKSRLDYLPTAERQPILDDRWHLLAFCSDANRKEARLFYDGVNVAIYSTTGFENLNIGQNPIVGGDRLKSSLLTDATGCFSNARFWNHKLSDEEVFSIYQERYPDAKRMSLPDRVDELKVLSWNIWHGARHNGIEKGIRQAIDFIRHSGADVITMQETYGSGPTIADSLGYYFYSRSSNLSILSRYPLENTHDIYEPFRLGGATVRLSPTQQTNIFSLWIHYLPAWRTDSANEGATAESLVAGEWKTRASELRDILKELKPFIDGANETPLIVGGDFNSPSKLDWTKATAQWHHGLAVDWPVSKQMLEAGFADSYRLMHPDPLIHLPHSMWKDDARRLTHRIDYLYSQGKTIQPIASVMMNTHNGTWPSDHPSVLTTYHMNNNVTRIITYNILEGFQVKPANETDGIDCFVHFSPFKLLTSSDLAEESKAARWFVTEEHATVSDHYPVSADLRWPLPVSQN